MNTTHHMKYCVSCDKQVHTSSFAKHLKSKLHLQKNGGVIPQEPRVLPAVVEEEQQQQPRARPIPTLKRKRRNIEIIIKIEK